MSPEAFVIAILIIAVIIVGYLILRSHNGHDR